MWLIWLSLAVRKVPDVLMNVAVPEHRAINNQILWWGKVYFSCVGKIEFDNFFSKPWVSLSSLSASAICSVSAAVLSVLNKTIITAVWIVIPTDLILNLTLDEWSTHCRNLYLTTHNTLKRKISMTRQDSNSQSQESSNCGSTP